LIRGYVKGVRMDVKIKLGKHYKNKVYKVGKYYKNGVYIDYVYKIKGDKIYTIYKRIGHKHNADFDSYTKNDSTKTILKEITKLEMVLLYNKEIKEIKNCVRNKNL